MIKSSVAVIVLNWNDANLLPISVGSLLKQNEPCDIIVVDNGSTDNSRQVIESFGTKISTVYNKKNLGFAGGVNSGIKYAISESYEFIGLLNNDAVADKDWVKQLRATLVSNEKLGGVTCAMLNKDGNTYDSTGEFYTTWGLPYPRGRDEKINNQYDNAPEVIAISGGASMFRADFFSDVGLFDENFFAYYEDVELGLRGHLKGWVFRFVPKAYVLHDRGSTSSRVRGFSTYQTFKNLPLIIIKTVPLKLFPTIIPRFTLAYLGFFVSAFSRRQLRFAVKGWLASLLYIPKKLVERSIIQHARKISTEEFASLLTWDLPPNADKLNRFRRRYWKLIEKNS